MKSHWSLLILTAVASICGGQETAPPPPPAPAAAVLPPRPRVVAAHAAWLGVGVSKPTPAVTAQVSGLPPGIGFIITAVAPDSPGAIAEIALDDILWKFDDQMLVNQGQLAALLAIKKPGEEVKLGLFRAGQPLEVKLKLGETPPGGSPFTPEMTEPILFPGSGGYKSIVIPGQRTASSTDERGSATLTGEGDGYKLVIADPNKKVVFDGTLSGDGDLDQVPSDWRRRVWSMRRALRHAMDNQITPVRPPRQRVVPPAPTGPSPSVPTPPAPPVATQNP